MNKYNFCDYPTPDTNGVCMGCGYTPCKSLNMPITKNNIDMMIDEGISEEAIQAETTYYAQDDQYDN